MRIEFSENVPQTDRVIAYVVDQDVLPAGLEPVLVEGARAARFTGKAGQMFEGFAEREVGLGERSVVRIVLVGVGERAASDDRLTAFERAGAGLVARYLTSGEGTLTVDVASNGATAEEIAALALAARLRAWRCDTYRTTLTDEQKPSLVAITIAGAPAGTADAWAAAAAVAEGVEFTRELVTEPANILYPESFVARCQARMSDSGLDLTVLDEDEMAALGMGALLGVAQGSVRPARLLVMRWRGGVEGVAPLALVGKGVTFDTGGISLKQPGGMEDMKWDMGGAGAVVGAMLALARRKARANVIGVCGLVENMPDGNAQRPGDVVTSMSGQTIEVINTDAEGRLVLCDALTWVQKEYAPATIIDLATLTGAVIAALGMEYAGIFANDTPLAEALMAAGRVTGDQLWRFPLGKPYDRMIDSPIADMKNVGGKYAGSITAAQFLQRFIDKGVAWAHLDIAGTVWADKPGRTWDKGATGYGVRLLDRFVRDTLETSVSAG